MSHENNIFKILCVVIVVIIVILIICYIDNQYNNKKQQTKKLHHFIIRDKRFCSAISKSSGELCANYHVKGEKYCYSHCTSKKYNLEVRNIDNFTKYN